MSDLVTEYGTYRKDEHVAEDDPIIVATTIVAGPGVTVVQVEFDIAFEGIEENYLITEDARRHNDDKYDPEVGLKLAYARAFEALGRKLKKQAEGKVAHNEWVRADKRRRREERALKRAAQLMAKPELIKQRE